MLKKGDTVEVTIYDLAFGGIGVGKLVTHDGSDFVVFVSKTVPGDRVKARLTKIKKNYAEAELEEVVTPSAERIAARCKHFGVCGGCSLQFLKYPNQLKWKQKMVSDALRNIGGFRDIVVNPIIGCNEPWFYRNKMEYSFGSEQSEQSKEAGRVILGLHPAKKYQEVFKMEECFLQSPLSVAIALSIAEWAREKNLTAWNPQTRTGVLRNVVVREGKNTGELLVNFIISEKNFPFDNEFAAFMRARFPMVTSLYRTGVLVQRGRRTVIEEHLLAGKPTLTEKLTVETKNGAAPLALSFEILPQAFMQPNTKQAQVLYGKILEFAQTEGNESVLDLFCGTGTIGMFFAKMGSTVLGIDMNSSAIENARENAAKNSLNNIDFRCCDVDDFFKAGASTSVQKYSLLITDPPRAGITQKTLQKILALKIPRWIYVSCNPATLARDLKIICEGGRYQIKKVQPVDMFPHTYHVETICLLTQESS